MDRFPLVIWSCLSGILLGLSWPHTGSLMPFIFIALVPLFIMEEIVYRRRYRPGKVFVQSYIAFIIFNLWTTYWVYFASGGGAAMAVIVNSLLMAVTFWLFHFTRRRVGKKEGYIAFVIYWITFEYLHFHWELSFPWLNLGNVFSESVRIVQWYDITGTAGGTLWIVAVNLLVFYFVRDVLMYQRRTMYSQTGRIIFTLLVIMVPVLISLRTYYNYEEKENPADIVIVQPNIDPYRDKFNGRVQPQLELFTALAETKMDTAADFLVGPETQLPFPVFENYIEEENEIEYLRSYMSRYPGTRLITGMSSFSVFPKKGNTSRSAKSTDHPDTLYDYYNSAIHMVTSEKTDIYHKMKLVLGVEKVPFAGLIPALEKLALNMGGASGTLGTEKAPVVFHSEVNSHLIVAPAICYESIYGEHLAGFIMAGANLIFIITNDGWWEDTPGYRQHMSYARLRAIENRRSIARCGNTGISCFINQRGDVISKTNWWEPDVLRETINANSSLTYYTQNGDYIGRASSFVAILLLLYTIVNFLRGKISHKGEV